MNLTELSKEIHQDNREKGFWDKERNVGEMLMLIVSELGEAMEALRKEKICDDETIKDLCNSSKSSDFRGYLHDDFLKYVKDTFQDEMADTLIRLLDLCGGLGIDIQSHVELKLAYNKLRPHKHGKKF